MNLIDGINNQIQKFRNEGFEYEFIKQHVLSRGQEFKIKCIKHNWTWDTSYIRFVEKQAKCVKCGVEQRATTKKIKNYRRFQVELREIFPGWSVVTRLEEYKSNKKNIRLRCPKGHTNSKSISTIRARINRSNKNIECSQCEEQSIIDLCKSHGFEFDKIKRIRTYQNKRRTYFTAICNLCRSRNNLVTDKITKGCHVCNKPFYYHEECTRQIFNHVFNNKFPHSNEIQGFRSRYPKFVNRRGNPLTLDGFCADLNLAFEYNHRQHWDKNDPFYSKEIVQNDKDKIKVATIVGINLIVVESRERTNNFEQFVYDKITEFCKIKKNLMRCYREIDDFKFDDTIILQKQKADWDRIRQYIKVNGGTLEIVPFKGRSADYNVICRNGHEFPFRWYDHFSGKRKHFCWDCGKKEPAVPKFKKMVLDYGFKFAKAKEPKVSNYDWEQQYEIICPHGQSISRSHRQFSVMVKRNTLPINECFRCKYIKSNNKEKLSKSLDSSLSIIKKQGRAIPLEEIREYRGKGINWKCLDCGTTIRRSLRSAENRIAGQKHLCSCIKSRTTAQL